MKSAASYPRICRIDGLAYSTVVSDVITRITSVECWTSALRRASLCVRSTLSVRAALSSARPTCAASVSRLFRVGFDATVASSKATAPASLALSQNRYREYRRRAEPRAEHHGVRVR